MKSLAELQAIKEKVQSGGDTVRVVIGLATCGMAAGASPVFEAFSEAVKANNLSGVSVTQTGCVGLCQYEPIAEIIKPGEETVTYINMDADKAKEVAEQHLVNGVIVDKYTVSNSALK